MNDNLSPSNFFEEVSEKIGQSNTPPTSGRDNYGMPLCVQWHITARKDGEIISEELSKNIVVKNGRDVMLQLLFGVGGSSYLSLGAGACSTAATANDYNLNYEHIGNATRKTLTNTSNVALTASDVDDEFYVDGCDFYKKITVRGTFALADGNNGQPFQEYGLFNTTVLPVNPCGISGGMYNHFVSGSPIQKDSATTIVVDVTIRA